MVVMPLQYNFGNAQKEVSRLLFVFHLVEQEILTLYQM